MPLTSTEKTAYQFLIHFLALLIAYAAAALIGAVKFLGADALAQTFPYSQISAFAGALLTLALLSGVIGGGLYALAHERPDRDFPTARLLRLARQGWTLVCILTIAAGLLGLLKGRAGLEFPPLIAVLVLIELAVVLIAVSCGVPRWWSLPTVWAIGMIAAACGIAMTLLPITAARADLWMVIAASLCDQVGIGLAVLALIFWQMHRFSDLSPGWVHTGLYSVAALWSLASMLLLLQSMIPLGIPAAASISPVGVVALPILIAIFASHAYLALSHRNTMRTLSAHWVSLAVVLLLISVGALGAVGSLPAAQLLIAGTRLADVQHLLILFAFAAALLGTLNQVGAELRRENRRITGLAPFWLVGFGVIVAAVALAMAGIVQVYLERMLSIGYLETQALMAPLYTVWVVGLISVALGLIGYALGVWARRSRG